MLDGNTFDAEPLTQETAVGCYNLGNAHLRKGEISQAVEQYSRAIALDPKRAEPYNNRGTARRRLGDHQGAIEDFAAAIRLNPALAEAHNNRGNARRHLGAPAESIADYNQALRLRPELALVYNNRGNAFVRLEDLSSALDNYNQALRLDPQMAEAHHNRGVVRYSAGDRAGASEDFHSAIRLDPEYLDAHINLRCLQVELGEIDEAVSGLEKASMLFFRHGDNQGYERIRSTIERIRGIAAGKALSDTSLSESSETQIVPTRDTPLVPGSQLVDEIKKIAQQGTARKITIKNAQGRTLLQIPLALGAVAGAGLAFLAPELTVVTALAALLSKVQVRIEPNSD